MPAPTLTCGVREILWFYFKYVSESLAACDVASVWAKLLSEAGDMNVNGAFSDNGTLPYPIHKLLAREYMTAIREKQTKQVELSAGEVNGVAVYGDGLSVKINLQSAKVKETLAKSGLNHIHYVVTQFLAFGNDVAVDETKGARIIMVAYFQDTFGLELVA